MHCTQYWRGRRVSKIELRMASSFTGSFTVPFLRCTSPCGAPHSPCTTGHAPNGRAISKLHQYASVRGYLQSTFAQPTSRHPPGKTLNTKLDILQYEYRTVPDLVGQILPGYTYGIERHSTLRCVSSRWIIGSITHFGPFYHSHDILLALSVSR